MPLIDQQQMDELILVYKHFFFEFCAERNLDTSQILRVAPIEFFRWMSTKAGTAIDELEIGNTLGVSPESVKLGFAILTDPFGCYEMVEPIWPLVAYSSQPLPPVPVVAAMIQCLVIFQDGRVQAFTLHKSKGEEPAKPADKVPLTLADVTLHWLAGAWRGIQRLVSDGMQRWHETAEALPKNIVFPDLILEDVDVSPSESDT